MAAQQPDLMWASGGSSFPSDEDGIADKFTEVSSEAQTPVLALTPTWNPGSIPSYRG